jgi:DNA-binding response OmpR family regulator
MRTPIIMLVDDEPMMLKLMAVALAREGWQIYQAKDATTALETGKTLACGLNVLVTDIEMPGMPGDELIRHIRKLCPYVDVLAISGALPEGCSGLRNSRVLKKPFKMDLLAEEIQDILSVQVS